MPTNMTLKNIPDAVYERLKASASEHRRSLNGEAIVCLEAVLLPPKRSVEQHLLAARAVRESLSPRVFESDDIDALKREGRS